MPALDEYLMRITGEKRELFDRFRTLLLEYNRKFNLTSLTEEREILIKHFLDSAAGEFLFPEGALVAEVGSGAGFPSLPLKILREDLKFTLFESTAKKCDFLKAAVSELGLRDVQVCHCRAEDAARGEFRERFDVCCARAVAGMPTLAEYCLPLVRVGGAFVAYKGAAEEELQAAESALSLLGGGKIECHMFSLPDGMGERTLIRVEKRAHTPAKYPRGRGRERSDPLK